MKTRRQFSLAFIFFVSQSICVGASTEDSALRLEAELLTPVVIERTPIVALLRIRNVSTRTVKTIFSPKYAHLIGDRAYLVLQDAIHRTYTLNYRGGPLPEKTAPIAAHPLEPDATIEIDRVVSLIVETPVPPRWAGRVSERYRFLGPGLYRGRFEVALLHGRKLVSNEFDLTILEAKGVDALVRNLIQFPHVGFLEGRDVPVDESVYRGGRSRDGVDWTRYREIQDILEKHPDSTYAKWIRFWKLYRYGPIDDALEYARTHKDFPLSDNLMLRMGERLFNSAGNYDFATYRRVRELGRELLRDFPNGDTRPAAQNLLNRLKNKLPPESED